MADERMSAQMNEVLADQVLPGALLTTLLLPGRSL